MNRAEQKEVRMSTSDPTEPPADGPYPDILRLVVEINGVDYRVVRPVTTLMVCDLYVRRMA